MRREVMKYNYDNWLSATISHLEMLKSVYEDEIMPTMIDDGDHEERIAEIQELIDYLNKTN